MLRKSYDIVIVGAGPAGTAAAAAFANQGADILIVEANPLASTRLAGEWLHPTGVAILRKLGLNNLLLNSVPGRGFFVRPDDGGELIRLSYPSGAGISCDHERIVASLREYARGFRNVHWLEGMRVVGLEGMELLMDDPSTRVTHRVKAGKIVGADGRASSVRGFIHGPAEKSVSVSSMAGVEIQGVSLPEEEYGYVLLGGPGPILMYRIDSDRIRACLDIPISDRASHSQRTPEYLWEAFSPVFPASMREAFRAAVFKNRIMWASNRFRARTQYGTDEVALVGDAVGCFHPLTASGMTLGLLDVDCLSTAASFSVYRRVREGQSYVPELLANALYEVFVRRDAGANAIRKAVFDAWRNSEEDRVRTMRILSGEEKRRGEFGRTFLHMASRAVKQTGADVIAQRDWKHLPQRIASLREWAQWPMASVMPNAVRNRVRHISTATTPIRGLPSFVFPRLSPSISSSTTGSP